MKRLLKLITICFVVCLLCGCGEKEKIVKCTLNKKDVINEYELKSEYVITTDGKIVKKAETTEIITSDKASILSYFETSLNDTYKKMNNAYGGYTYDVSKNDNKVTSKVTIDYAKLNLEQLGKDDASIKSALNDKNEITLDGLMSVYKAMGATCEQ